MFYLSMFAAEPAYLGANNLKVSACGCTRFGRWSLNAAKTRCGDADKSVMSISVDGAPHNWRLRRAAYELLVE